MTRMEEIATRTADAMARLVAEGIKSGLSFTEAYEAARSYMVGRWPYLANVIPAEVAA